MSPINLKKLSFQKDFLRTTEFLASLDGGCSLIKIIYLDKFDEEKSHSEISNSKITLTLALFENDKFDEALFWLKEKAYFPQNPLAQIHLTGAGGVKHSKKIKEILEREVLFLDEYLSQARGAFYLLANASFQDIIYDEIETDCKESFNTPFVNNTKLFFEEIVGKQTEKHDFDPNKDIFPCIYAIMGSGAGCMRLNSDGTFQVASPMSAVGKPFLGLCKCILGTKNYDEIITMASLGDRRNVDKTVGEILPEDYAYGELPSDLPIIYLGKLSETKKDISEYNKNDIAHSLVSMFVYNAMVNAIHVCIAEKIRNVFFGGNFFQGEIFRKEYSTLKKMYNLDYINFYFVNTGHTAALGAMVSSPGDMEKYFKLK